MRAKTAQSMVGREGDGARTPGRFSDIYVVFSSPTDAGCFEAHSLKTNQIGIGETIEEALYELFASLVDLLHEYRDPANKGQVCLWQPAPPEIIEKLISAETVKIPQELVARVVQKIRGVGSPEWKPDTSDTDYIADHDADDSHLLESSPAFGVISEDALEFANA